MTKMYKNLVALQKFHGTLVAFLHLKVLLLQPEKACSYTGQFLFSNFKPQYFFE